MARGQIVVLVGIDGSGKSTQAALLADALRAAGLRARAFENPGGRPILDAVARRLGRADGAALVGQRGRVAIELAVRSAAIARSACWAPLTGGTAVMDRYTFCQQATMRARGDRGQRCAARWARCAPRPDLVFWLRVEPAVAQQRVAARGRDRESHAWLEAFDGAYASLLPSSAQIVDASGAVHEVHRALLALVTPLSRSADITGGTAHSPARITGCDQDRTAGQTIAPRRRAD
ncbi:MAG: AAA family ATPase [Patulibacter sp.]